MERYLRVNLLGPGPRLTKKIIYRAAVSKRLRNTGLEYHIRHCFSRLTLKDKLVRKQTESVVAYFK